MLVSFIHSKKHIVASEKIWRKVSVMVVRKVSECRPVKQFRPLQFGKEVNEEGCSRLGCEVIRQKPLREYLLVIFYSRRTRKEQMRW